MIARFMTASSPRAPSEIAKIYAYENPSRGSQAARQVSLYPAQTPFKGVQGG